MIFGAERVRPIQSPDPSLNNDAVNVRSYVRIKSTAKHPHTILVCRNTLRYVSAFSFPFQGIETLIFWHLEEAVVLGWIVVGLL